MSLPLLMLIRVAKGMEKMSPRGLKIARPSEKLLLFLLLPHQQLCFLLSGYLELSTVQAAMVWGEKSHGNA